MADEPASQELQSFDSNQMPWGELYIDQLRVGIPLKAFVSDPDTGMSVQMIRYETGFTNPWHRHNCAHGIYVLDGVLKTHTGTFGLGVSRQTVSRWQGHWRDHGTEGLRSLGPPGRAPKLSVAQLDLVERALLRGAKAHGFDTELWTLGRIAEVIWRTTGVRHHPAQVWRLLRQRMGWSLQRPARRASERDEEAIRQWVAVDWPRIKKTPDAARQPSSSSTSRASR